MFSKIISRLPSARFLRFSSNFGKMEASVYDQLMKDGIVVIKDFCSPEEVSELHEAGKKMCHEAPKKDRTIFSSAANSSHTSTDYFLDSGDKVHYFFESGAVGENHELLVPIEISLNKVGHGLHYDHPIFSKFTFSEKITNLVKSLKYKRPAVTQSMYIYKNPSVSKAVSSHQDSCFMHTDPPSCIGLWFPLENATDENGCLKAIKGSHKSGVQRRFIRNPDKTSKELVIYDRPAIEYPIEDFTAFPANKGSVVLIHGEVVHRSEPNTSKRSRHVYTFHVVETKDTIFSKENWLQPKADKPFKIFYDDV